MVMILISLDTRRDHDFLSSVTRSLLMPSTGSRQHRVSVIALIDHPSYV